MTKEEHIRCYYALLGFYAVGAEADTEFHPGNMAVFMFLTRCLLRHDRISFPLPCLP